MITWTPVPQGFTHSETHTRVTSQIEIASEDGSEMIVREWWSNPDGVVRIWYRLPDNLRLCRAVPVTWSQEPPTEEGKYWCWMRGWPDVVCCRVWMHDNGEVFREMGHGFYVPRGAWYTPATVPQPPGEVGP